jgi:hypothetical protein
VKEVPPLESQTNDTNEPLQPEPTGRPGAYNRGFAAVVGGLLGFMVGAFFFDGMGALLTFS